MIFRCVSDKPAPMVAEIQSRYPLGARPLKGAHFDRNISQFASYNGIFSQENVSALALAEKAHQLFKNTPESTHPNKKSFKIKGRHVVHLLHQRELVLSNERLASENKDLWKRLGYEPGHRVVGSNLGLKGVMQNVRQVASLRSPVLLTGETGGVGKEVIAKAIHNASDRSQGPMISVNCGAIPETLLESELFDFEKGAFTSANHQKKGYFERSNNGTIFLDEISELSLQAQVKLLRVLQEYDWPGNVRELQDVIAHHIEKARHLTHGRIEGRKGAAELLGMKPSTLRGRMRKLGIRVERTIHETSG